VGYWAEVAGIAIEGSGVRGLRLYQKSRMETAWSKRWMWLTKPGAIQLKRGAQRKKGAG